MCGIAGLLELSASADRRALHGYAQNMAGALVHRGPDDGGVWQDPDVPLVLAHRRLSILDLSPEGHQPMASASERYVVSYNGEIYNYLDLQADLERAGVAFRGRSDTEVLLAAVDQWGLNLTLQKINGMFAFALWDRQERTLHLVRDRLGKKPLYVGWAGKAVLFASELKALRAHPDFRPEINRHVLGLYMRYGYVPAPYCIYKGVFTLPPGCRMVLDAENLQPGSDLSASIEPYWHHANVTTQAREKMRGLSDEEATEDFESLLSTCVRERMISDVPLGAFLSGGIDSSAIVALMQREAGPPVKTYTIGFHEAGFDEAAPARKIAAHLGTDHHELYLNPQDALAVIPSLPEIYDEPFADISAIPTYLVSRFARQDVTVALSGDGGDEMFGGYNRHFTGPKLWNRMKMMPLPLRRWMARGIKKWPTEHWDRVNPKHPQFGEKLYKLADALPLEGPEIIYKRLLSQWDKPPATDASELPIPLWQEEWMPKGLSFAERMMFGDALSYLPNDILVKVDRASMAVSLEARAPLLDARIYEFAWSLPERMKIRDGKGKWLLRKVLHRHVPKTLFERPKQGFNMPVGAWLRGDLRDWAESLLAEDRLANEGWLDAEQVRAVWQEHLNGTGNHATKLWTVLMFQAWLER